MFNPFHKKPLLPLPEQEQVVSCIREAEAKTTGEIRVFVESHCDYMDAMDKAKELFEQLGMEQTERRNAVLVYVAIQDKQFAIMGDTEIYTQAGGPAFWQQAAARLLEYLKQGQITQGLCHCIQELGHALAIHFPYDPAVARNELPDEIVFGK